MTQDTAPSPSDDAQLTATDRLRRFVAANRLAIIVVAVAFVLRLIWLLYAQPVPISDFNDYRNLAANIVDHGRFGYPRPTTFYLPVHPVTLALLMLVSRSDLWLGFGMVLVSTASCLLVYLVGRRLFDRESTALIAASIFAVLPTFVFYSPVLATEHMFIALMLASLLVALRLGTSTGWRALGLGALLGLAILTRGEAMFYVLAFVSFLWLAPGTSRPVRIRQSLVAAIGLVTVLTPWYVRNSLVADPDVGLSSGSGINFYFAHNDSGNYGWHLNDPFVGMTPEDANREGWRLGIEYLRENPLRIFKDVLRGTRQLFAIPDYAIQYSTQEFRPPNPEAVAKELRFREPFTYALRLGAMMHLSAAALALVLVRQWARPLAALLMPLIVLSWVWRTVLFWGAPRYGYFIVVMLVFFSALTIDTLIRAGRGRSPALS
jgi:hypothetical protein